MDGSLITIWKHRDPAKGWQVSTKGRPLADGNINGLDLTFRDLFENALAHVGIVNFISALDPGLFYAFELTAPENRIIVHYPSPGLTWIGAWNVDGLSERHLQGLPDLPGVPKVSMTKFQALSDAIAHLNELKGHEAEGFVIVDNDFRRIKLKSAAYVIAHRAMASLNSARNQMELILSGQLDDFCLSYQITTVMN